MFINKLCINRFCLIIFIIIKSVIVTFCAHVTSTTSDVLDHHSTLSGEGSTRRSNSTHLLNTPASSAVGREGTRACLRATLHGRQV